MATTSSTTKSKPENQNLNRTKSLGRKPKAPSSLSSEDGSDQKPEKPLPNYLKPTISSRPDPVKFVKKNNNSVDENQKLLRRRSFDRPPSSLTSPSTSSPRIQKSLDVSPARPRDRPAVPREKPVTALRSSSFHGSRGVPRGVPSVKSPPVAPKKSGLSTSSTSLKSKKEGSTNVTIKKSSDHQKDITLDSASLTSAQEDEEEILKAESDVHVADDDIEEPKDEKEDEEVQVEVVQAGEEKEISGEPTTIASPVVEDFIVVAKEAEKEKEEFISEHKTEEKREETKEEENNQHNKGEDEDEVKKNIDEDENPEKIDVDMKEATSVKETTEEKEEVKEEKEVKEEEIREKVREEETEKEKEKVKEEEKEKVKDEEKVKEQDSGEVKKREVVKGKKESPSAYNDVIASKMQGNSRKNKVLALAGAFQTVIDYETAASK